MRQFTSLVFACILVLTGAVSAAAETLFAARQPMFDAAPPPQGAQARSPSLFSGTSAGSLLARLPGQLDAPLRHGGSVAARLRDLIAAAEAGRMGYDAVQHGARIKPQKPPTQMTLAEIYAWIDATPGQPHAIGRYQFIPATLRHSARRLDIPANTRFGPAVQDRLADLLLGDAGLRAVTAGEISREAFMLNLAKIWAGLPTASGRSYYHGIAGNKAVIGYARYAQEMRRILGG